MKESRSSVKRVIELLEKYNVKIENEEELSGHVEWLLSRLERYEKALQALNHAIDFDKEITTSHLEEEMKSATSGTQILILQGEIERMNAIDNAFKLAKEALKEE